MKQNQTPADKAYMKHALELARRQAGRTAPNPSVGCVLVRGGKIVGRGATADDGRPHAETLALKEAGPLARGSTAYVTLEPCSHFGQTGPCADALIKAGISRCVIASIDPDPRVNWRGAAKLQEAGIDTIIGLCDQAAQAINPDFFKV